ncbi:hypothetical protein ACFFMN_23325 [Planobispora siamensis]|uniref:Uncharacterized protein n=1 Tax=Planobispora siamensis TaxID=936338 RepID=A0A8J3SL76_9ACTN|nr:hypothetical protein [Planobispora siamensis]GIH95294.1 hypothetical protein Psi01_59240 [Planobispora siamensis]
MTLPAEMRRANAHDLAALLTTLSTMAEIPMGMRHIDANQITSWYRRRRVTGFPDALPDKSTQRAVRPVRVWDTMAVVVWAGTFQPGKRGAPVGNTSALKHGRYVGRRAAQASRNRPSPF